MSLRSIVRIKHLPDLTGLSSTTIRRMITDKTFPAPFKLAARAVGWDLTDIQRWLECRKNEKAVQA